MMQLVGQRRATSNREGLSQPRRLAPPARKIDGIPGEEAGAAETEKCADEKDEDGLLHTIHGRYIHDGVSLSAH